MEHTVGRNGHEALGYRHGWLCRVNVSPNWRSESVSVLAELWRIEFVVIAILTQLSGDRRSLLRTVPLSNDHQQVARRSSREVSSRFDD